MFVNYVPLELYGQEYLVQIIVPLVHNQLMENVNVVVEFSIKINVLLVVQLDILQFMVIVLNAMNLVKVVMETSLDVLIALMEKL